MYSRNTCHLIVGLVSPEVQRQASVVRLLLSCRITPMLNTHHARQRTPQHKEKVHHKLLIAMRTLESYRAPPMLGMLLSGQHRQQLRDPHV